MNKEEQEIDKLKEEIKKIKDWLQIWVINRESGGAWRSLMERDLR